jgi:hypothetical protein
MSVTVRERELISIGSQPAATGPQPCDTYCGRTIILSPDTAFLVVGVEIPDEQLFQHIVWSGSLDWLAEPGEDVYTVEDGEPL